MKLSTFVRSGYTHAVLAAVCVTGYVLTTRAAYNDTNLSSSTYVAWFVVFAGVVAFIDSTISIGPKSTLLMFRVKKNETPSKWRPILNGIMATFGFAVFAFGQHKTSATNASVILAANMVPTAFFSWCVFKKGVSRIQFGSMAIVLVGLYIAVVGLTSIELQSGDLIVTFAAIIIGFTNNYMKTLMGDFSPRVIADVRLITGAFFALLYLIVEHSSNGFGFKTISYPIIAGIFFWSSVMAVVSAVDKVHTNEAIVVTQLHILVTPVAAAFLLDEKYRYTTLLGSLIMLAGVIVFSRDGHLNKTSESFEKANLSKPASPTIT